MATTKTKSRGKTKTSKTAAKRATSTKSKVTKKTSAAAKSTKAALQAKVTKPAKPAPTFKQLRQLNIASVVLALLLAVAAGLLMNGASYQLFTGLLTKNELASRTTTVFAPAIHPVLDLELRWVVEGFW